ncbi:ATP-NAD kinase family protein [Ferrimonas sp. SCSIO 43195]|uniref:ATP-NAD kinase family protein n=1 Tax=Ferrimonas sp. SCSIO 43195 TaxID=2822844 RepID=UPI002074EC91|nr:ATP-NAD kinase family protein [Ferrimonas sp. SCSIO 43195]USD36666.1 ATP-NAD kinase family protein [Ferrimonas sp. SCSIO 43195]
MNRPFRLGVIINPLAGLGGSVALKGSDNLSQQALALGAIPKAQQRMAAALNACQSQWPAIDWVAAGGAMGGDLLTGLGIPHHCLYRSGDDSEAADTQAATRAMMEHGVDLLLFAGGDGTARDICSVVGERQPVLGVPAGVKIHSGVYGITPKASGEVVAMMSRGELVSTMMAEVRDIDEAAFRQGRVQARHYGEMRIPEALQFVQAVKMGGVEVDELVLDDICADLQERMEEGGQFVMGSGSTVAAAMAMQGLDNTLLGVDVVRDGQLIGRDLTAAQLLKLVAEVPSRLVVTLIGGQGHLFGRGNQQLSPEVIRAIGRDNILILATKSKLKALEGRPMIADTGDPELDAQLAGWYPIITGFHDEVLYRLT